jgi:hypothetical protein
MKEEIKFRLGDRVFSPHFGKGIVTDIDDRPNIRYPIAVQWEPESDVFTLDGKYSLVDEVPDFGITSMKVVKGAEGFKVGDRVYFNSNGYGTITKLTQSKTEQYPIEVKWDDTNITSTFTKDGYVWSCHTDNDPKLSVVKANRLAKDMSLEEKEAEAERISNEMDKKFMEEYEKMDAEGEKFDDAINPKHYKVKGIPEAIEIMEHLMTKEQFEGFLWGNILKYAYRYGRKGDKKETAGKIAWYAKKLEEAMRNE